MKHHFFNRLERSDDVQVVEKVNKQLEIQAAYLL